MLDTQHPQHRYFHSFCVRPDIKFDTQEKDEEVILILRAHPITQIPWILASVGAFILLIVLNFFLPQFLNARQIVFTNLLGISVIFAYVWLRIIFYLFNVGIITNKRVIDLDFHSILYRESTEARLAKIEDITAKQGGYFGSFFNYGNVFVQTAGTEVNIEFILVPAPTTVVKLINEVAKR